MSVKQQEIMQKRNYAKELHDRSIGLLHLNMFDNEILTHEECHYAKVGNAIINLYISKYGNTPVYLVTKHVRNTACFEDESDEIIFVTTNLSNAREKVLDVKRVMIESVEQLAD